MGVDQSNEDTFLPISQLTLLARAQRRWTAS